LTYGAPGEAAGNFPIPLDGNVDASGESLIAFGDDGKLYGTDFVNNPGLYLIDMKTGFETAVAKLPPGPSSGLELVSRDHDKE
jgi:hypothetical protein